MRGSPATGRVWMRGPPMSVRLRHHDQVLSALLELPADLADPAHRQGRIARDDDGVGAGEFEHARHVVDGTEEGDLDSGSR